MEETMSTAFLFSGQGSQCAGMGVSLAAVSQGAKRVFDTASQVLGYDLLEKCAAAPMEELSRTSISQPAIMAVSLGAAEALRERGITADTVAGHSLGEYAAMVYSGIVGMKEGFELIKARSAAMEKAAAASEGAMYAVMKIDAKEIERICGETEGYVLPVNYNSPMQTVIAGELSACEAAVEKLSEMKGKVVRLKVASAFHSRLMQPAADEFLQTAEKYTYSAPSVTFMSNITGGAISDTDGFAQRLAQHIVSPVRFTDELFAMRDAGVDTFIECGPGHVLAGLVKKTLEGVTIYNVENEDTLSAVK
jgi:[acyl-carrier-protein] S-malonyltransferase